MPGLRINFATLARHASPGLARLPAIDSSGFVNGGRTITASAVDWSSTATFLLEAEVFRSAISSRVRMLYPVVFGQSLHFTLPQRKRE